jgi:hypothetical protein
MTAPQRPWDVQARLAGMEGQETRALRFPTIPGSYVK